MSVIIQKKDLLNAMQKALPVVPSKTSLQILSNFKLSYANSVFEIAATDADHSLRVTTGASGEGPLDITVNARRVFEMVRGLGEGDVKLTADGMVLVIESEGYKGKISGADSGDFPGVPSIDDRIELSVSCQALRDMITKSAFAVSKDESRASLCGILWEFSADKTGMVSTDGHRLGCSFVNTTLPIDAPFSKIFSQKSVSTLVRVTDSKNQDESIRVIIGDKYAAFETPSFSMVSKLIDGQYPEYSKVIPKNNPKIIIADRVSILDAINRVSGGISNPKSNLVKFTFSSGQLETVAKNRDIGCEAKATVPIEYDGDEHTVGFNYVYFSEILEIIKTEKVKLEMNTQISACLIFPEYADEEKEKTSEDLYLIMPLRIMDEV